MSTHTPGPWTAVQDGNKVDWYIVDDDENLVVFGLSEPDAHISAAAPDMLAVLKSLVVNDGRIQGVNLGALECAVKAAIAKAEGTS